MKRLASNFIMRKENLKQIRKILLAYNVYTPSHGVLYCIYKPKTNTSRTKNTNDDEKAYKFHPLYGGESTSFHRHMISVVVFSYSETLESMLVEYAAT